MYINKYPYYINMKYCMLQSKLKYVASSLYINTSRTSMWLKQTGCYKCSMSRCGLCRFLKKTKDYTSIRIYCVDPIKSFKHCNTIHVIYLMKSNQKSFAVNT